MVIFKIEGGAKKWAWFLIIVGKTNKNQDWILIIVGAKKWSLFLKIEGGAKKWAWI